MGNKNPRSAYFSSKNWLWGSVSGLTGKRYSQQPVQDYEVNEDGTITAYGGTYNISTDAQGRKYFDVLIPEYDPKTKTGPYLNRGFDHIDSSGRVIGRGETYNRYYVGNLIPIQKEEVVVPTIVEEPKPVVPPKKYTTLVYYPDGRLLAKRIWTEGQKGKSYITGDGMDLNDYLKGGWYSGDSDTTFFNYLKAFEKPTSEWQIKSGDYRKPGKVYLMDVRETPKPEPTKKEQVSSSTTVTPEKVKGTLDTIRNLFGFKIGGQIDYLKFYK